MEEILLSKAAFLTSPNPLTLVCTEKEDGTTNLATVSWWTYLSFKPGMVAIAMSKKSYSGDMIRIRKQAIITIPGSSLANAVMKCGKVSGRTIDKVSEFDIEMQKLANSSIMVPVHCRVAIQCSMKEYLEVGDHYLYVFFVDKVFGNDEENAVFAWNGYSEIRTAK